MFGILMFAAFAQAGEVRPFDSGWRFLKGDFANLEWVGVDDSKWQRVEVPHDWSIAGEIDEKNPTGRGGGYFPSGVAWYRRHFTLRPGDAGKRVRIEFDGVMSNSDVWINGTHLGKRPNGYVSFHYDLTPHLKTAANASNVIAVRTDTSAQPASRWYTGAGIYRSVRLIVSDPVHLERWSTFVTTPKVTAQEATVHVEAKIVNLSNAAATVYLTAELDRRAAGESEPVLVPPGSSAPLEFEFAIRSPQLWDLSSPKLYQLSVAVVEGGKMHDLERIEFGIRDARFQSATGFWLNGKNIKLKGVALHHDAGALGAAVPRAILRRRLATLKQMGVNAIRTAHNPPPPELLELCDRLGLLVMDELFDCWTVAKNPHDYHLYFNEWWERDLRDTVRRDRNHPSVILWSAGNEIHDTPKEDLAKEILRKLVDEFHRNDPTRPVTQALFRPNVSHDYTNGLADMLDVVGTNYRFQELLAAHRDKPSRKILGTENQHDLANWLAVRDNPQYAGHFLWSGIDYLGEADWPNISHPFGLLDRTGAKNGIGYRRESWWSDQPMVHMERVVGRPSREGVPNTVADWNIPQGGEQTIEVYSNADEVQLMLNERSLGVKPRADLETRIWKVAYEPGSLKAIARNKGQVVATDEWKTAGKSQRIVVSWDQDGFVIASIVDDDGIRNPLATDLLTFKVEGGTLLAVDNADRASHEPFVANQRHAYRGRAVAIVRPDSVSYTVKVSAPGLKSNIN